MIDDLVIGDYGGDCSAASAHRGAVCHCNQGGRTVYMKRFVKDFRAEKISRGDLQLDLRECYSVKKKLKSKLIELAVVMKDNLRALGSLVELIIGTDAALNGYDLALRLRSFTLEIIESTMADAHVALTMTSEESLVHVVVGLVTEAMLDVPNVTFIDPLFMHPRLNKFRRNVIHLSPTVEQELFVLAQYLGNTSDASAAAVI
ncbi:receptor-type adenylate cyclase, partial [Trypanosoma theileri]